MKDEIKEILDKLNNKAEHYILYDYETHLLLDYITNLQEENERLTRSIVSYDETLLKRNNEYEDYKSRIEKAIEYLEQPYRDNFDFSKAQLLSILQGVGKDE